MNDAGYKGAATVGAFCGDENALAFLIESILGKTATLSLVVVRAVTAGDTGPVGTVDVQPLVAQIDGQGQPMPHGTIFALPYMRIQGGTSAVILDPQVGDLGLAAFCSHDISQVKQTKAPGLPGSRRRYDWSDGLYIGGFLNGAPTQYVRFGTNGVQIVSPSKVTVQAPNVELDGAIKLNGDIEVTGNLLVDGTSNLGGTGGLAVKRSDNSNATKVKAV